MKVWDWIVNAICPMCPRGGHRQRGRLVRAMWGELYCWHPDCITAAFRKSDLLDEVKEIGRQIRIAVEVDRRLQRVEIK